MFDLYTEVLNSQGPSLTVTVINMMTIFHSLLEPLILLRVGADLSCHCTKDGVHQDRLLV